MSDDIRQSYLVILIVLWNCIKTNVCHADGKCLKGTFKSDFLSGGCVLCPRKLKYCENQQVDDSIRCFKACRKIYSTPLPTKKQATTTDFPKSSVSLHPTTLTTKASEIPTQVQEVSSKRQNVYNNFKTTLAVNSTPYSTSGRYGESNTTDIVIGIAMSIAALLLVVVVLFAICRKGRSTNSTKEQQQNLIYVAVPSSSISNRDDNMKPEATSVTEGQTDDENEERWLPALSRERLNEMPETHL